MESKSLLFASRAIATSTLIAAALLAAWQPACSQCLALPVCSNNEFEVAECADGDDTCHEVELCGTTILCSADTAQCNAYPACQPGDMEVQECPAAATCYDASICGTTIHCLPAAQCDAEPVCDSGDVEGDCPAGGDCYDVTVCGTTITCIDDGQPLHGCPEDEPTAGDICDPTGVPAECFYPPCGFYACEEGAGALTWTVVGGCAEA